jgi:MFS family permease
VSTPPAAARGDDGLVLASARGRWVLLATVLGSAIASVDATVVGIALPAIGREFGVGLAALQWVVTAYTMTLAGLLLLAGSLGDKYGRKKVFLIGVVWFAVASLLCAVAPGSTFLILARALQGVGAALLTPGSLAILEAVFRPDDRGPAIGAWSGYAGVGTAIGPFVGGYLVQAVSWRLIFVINLPLAALVVAVSLRHVPESRDPQATGRIDVLGGTLVTLGLVALTYGLIEGPGGHWLSPAVLAALIAGVVLLGAFVVQELRSKDPMLPLGLFASTQFTATNVITFVVYGGIGGALFLLPIQLQQVSGYTALEAGISLLPVTAITLLLSRRSGALAADERGTGAGRHRPGPVHPDHRIRRLPHRGAARRAGVRLRPGRNRGAAHVHRAGRGARGARGHRVGGQQRRGPGGGAHRRGPAARRGRDHRRRLPAQGRVLGRVPHRVAHLGRAVRGGRPAGRLHHPQPGPGCRGGPADGRAGPLRARRSPSGGQQCGGLATIASGTSRTATLRVPGEHHGLHDEVSFGSSALVSPAPVSATPVSSAQAASS